MSEEYKKVEPNDLFWINQPLDMYTDYIFELLRNILDGEEESENKALKKSIKHSNNDFRNIVI